LKESGGGHTFLKSGYPAEAARKELKGQQEIMCLVHDQAPGRQLGKN